MTDARLSSSEVTSSAIYLRGAEITFKWNNLIEPNVIPSLIDTSSDAQTEAHYMGWQNPSYTIRGLIDETGDSSNVLTLSLLKQFAQVTSSLYLYDDVFAPTGTQIIIKDFTIPRVATYKTKIYDYTINALTTK